MTPPRPKSPRTEDRARHIHVTLTSLRTDPERFGCWAGARKKTARSPRTRKKKIVAAKRSAEASVRRKATRSSVAAKPKSEPPLPAGPESDPSTMGSGALRAAHNFASARHGSSPRVATTPSILETDSNRSYGGFTGVRASTVRDQYRMSGTDSCSSSLPLRRGCADGHGGSARASLPLPDSESSDGMMKNLVNRAYMQFDGSTMAHLGGTSDPARAPVGQATSYVAFHHPDPLSSGNHIGPKATSSGPTAHPHASALKAWKESSSTRDETLTRPHRATLTPTGLGTTIPISPDPIATNPSSAVGYSSDSQARCSSRELGITLQQQNGLVWMPLEPGESQPPSQVRTASHSHQERDMSAIDNHPCVTRAHPVDPLPSLPIVAPSWVEQQTHHPPSMRISSYSSLRGALSEGAYM
ncbi:hypothetical protein BV20DRAFT_1115256 [Pilatotrama ljubarskyi]|nr:hypothetical protein BV20DRAFT_1115256 [Pilatotrama ljubarskyi]